MAVVVDYLQNSGLISIKTDQIDFVWKTFVTIITDYDEEHYYLYDGEIRLSWRSFLPLRSVVVDYFRQYEIPVSLTDSSRELMRKVKNRSYEAAIKTPIVQGEVIIDNIFSKGFKRELKKNQLNNLTKIVGKTACATFSVPGAGKTTEALAYFTYNSDSNTHLLVVAPKNAFGAWDEQLSLCFPKSSCKMVRLVGGEKSIKNILASDPRFAIINYTQFTKVKDIIRNYVEAHDTIMFLDESHRIKNNRGGVTTESILELSFSPRCKLIMSGTPMPQSVEDLIPQFRFLYPDKEVNQENVVSLFQPLFVRTTKAQLELPEPERRKVLIDMDGYQSKIYKLLKSRIACEFNGLLNDKTKSRLTKLGKCIVKLVQFTSNPALLARDLDYAFDQQMGKLLLDCNGPKIEYACRRARELSKQGKKVIIWSSFVQNVELIAERLSDLGAEYIHGGVGAGSEDEDDTREGKIKRFHNDNTCMVLVANPAAASEGISLHTVCQNAIYVDRSFNAAQYLQSEDRIHRLGLRDDQHPIIEILECRGTVDEVIRNRLEQKIHKMSDVLNDPSLRIDTIPYDYEPEDDYDQNLPSLYISNEDAKALYDYLRGED